MDERLDVVGSDGRCRNEMQRNGLKIGHNLTPTQTIDWHVMQDPKEPTKFCIVERYEKESSQEYHLNNPVSFSFSLPVVDGVWGRDCIWLLGVKKNHDGGGSESKEGKMITKLKVITTSDKAE